jgi:tRNA-2-methylthio-N6-dimethylallyladenosine synthase
MEVSLNRKDGTREQIDAATAWPCVTRHATNALSGVYSIRIGCDKFAYCMCQASADPNKAAPAINPRRVEPTRREGRKEIILLGQTVNSYKYREGEHIWRLRLFESHSQSMASNESNSSRTILRT